MRDGRPYSRLGKMMDRLARERDIRGPYVLADYLSSWAEESGWEGKVPARGTVSDYFRGKAYPHRNIIDLFTEALDLSARGQQELAWVYTFESRPLEEASAEPDSHNLRGAEEGESLPPEPTTFPLGEDAPMNEIIERDARLALMVHTPDEPGALHALTRVILEHRANIIEVDIADRREDSSTIYFELEDVAAPDALMSDIGALPIARVVERAPSFAKVYGKRIIVIGGGAQVGQVVVGAVAEADRHNIRGERISVDTIPLVGEENLAAAVRAVARLPRAVALVLAGALMGGDVARAVREIREKGIIVLSLNMPGSVPDAADLVVSDPVQAGVMAVMAVSASARFDIRRHQGRRY